MDAQARLKNVFKLSHRITIYCPTQDQNGHEIESDIVDDTLTLLSNECGGATATPAMGCWVTGNGLLIKENVALVFAYCESLTEDLINVILDYCENAKRILDQDSIAIEIDGELYLV